MCSVPGAIGAKYRTRDVADSVRFGFLKFFFKLKVSSDSLENIVIFLRKCDHVAVPVEGHLCADACAPGCSAKERAMVQASLPEQAHVACGVWPAPTLRVPSPTRDAGSARPTVQKVLRHRQAKQ